jgi:hypothetical protein
MGKDLMPRQNRIPASLDLILRHVEAVCAITKYLNGREFEADAARLRDWIVDEAVRSHPRLEGWNSGPDGKLGYLWQSGEWKPKGPREGPSVGFTLAFPADSSDPHPYAYLYLPDGGQRTKLMVGRLLEIHKASGLQHYQDKQHEDEYSETTPVWVWVKYSAYAKDGKFNSNGFVKAMVEAIGKILKLKGEIDRIYRPKG